MAHILIVDDDPRVTEVVATQLRAGGHKTSHLSNGRDVLDTLKAGEFDLLILDVMLPGVSGFELCRRIRRDTEFYSLPIVILTSMANDEEVMHGLAQGADDYIVKPFDVNNVVQRVEALLRSSSEGSGIDEATSLPSGDKTKRELQRRTIMQEAFAVGYAELLGIREFAYCWGPEARMKAIRHFARALERVGKELKIDSFFVGHMGGGHFVCLLPPDKAKNYCLAVKKVWDSHHDEFVASLGPPRKPTEGAKHRLDVLICLTQHTSKEASTPQAMFEILSQIRHKAQSSRQGGVYMDRRA